MTALLIPITLDVLVVRAGQAEPWAVTQLAQPSLAGTTRRRQQLAPDPFQTLPTGRPSGAYLHWVLPDALGQGVQNDVGTTVFPPIPNRWIVLRLSGPATPGGRRVDGWMLPDISTAAPATVANFLDGPEPGSAPTPAEPLTILGHGDASWAAYFDNVSGRLAFYDDLATATPGPVSYLVCGWYLNPNLDPLPRGNETALRSYLLRQNWQAELPAGQPLPTLSLFHGSAVSIGWPDAHWPGDGGLLGDEPELRPAAGNVEVAAGVTLADALAVFTASPDEVALARLMTGLFSGALDRLASADGPAQLDTVLHADRFGSVPSQATSETIYQASPSGSGAAKFQPVRTAAPRAWHPAEPTLLLRGAGRSFRHGGDGRFADTGALDCRIEGHTVTAFGVAGGNPGDGAAVLPTNRLDALAARTPAAARALLIELAALDPGSAPDLDEATATQPSPVAAIRAAWWATWDPGTGPGPLDGATIVGTLPSPVSVSPPARPWTPLHLEWRADYFPSLRGHHDWELSDLDFVPDPLAALAEQPTHHIKGRILLTPAGASVAAEVELAEPAGERITDAGTLANQDLLSGSLDHLSQQLRGDPIDALVQAAGASAAPLPSTPLPSTFVGLRAGALSLTALRVVDGYGRTLDLPPTPQPSVDAGFPPLPGSLGLPPRFTSPTRILLRYTDSTGEPADADSGRSPVCGYLVPSPVDGTLEFFSADAAGLGRLRPDPVGGAAWEPDPGRPANAGSRPGADIVNPFLAAVAESILAADHAAALGGASGTETVLNGVQQVIDTTRWTVDLSGRTGDEHLALLLGAPIAVLRAAILLEVDDPRQPPGLAANAVPVKLGTLAHQQDGLLGYFVGDDYRRMHVVDPAVRDSVDGVFADAYLADPVFTVQPGAPVTLTLLTVPNTDVHVTAGLVPQKSVGQLREWTAPALSRLSPALRYGPILRDAGTTRLPFPADIRGTWTWHRRPDPGSWASDPVVRATADAVLSPALPEASDGWLQVALLPDTLYRDTATHVGISSVRTRRGPRGTRGEILAVGIPDPDGGRSLLTIAEAARLQESGRFAFHVTPTGAEVHVITDARGVKSLSTSTNPSDPNGLALLPEAEGTVDRLAPATGTQGTSLHLILRGAGLADVTELTFTDPGIEVTSMVKADTWVDVAITIDNEVTPGPQTLTLFTAAGTADTSRVSFEVVAAGAGVTRWIAGTGSSNWGSSGNWSAGVPTESSIAIIDTPANVTGPGGLVKLRGLILDSTASVSITSLAVSFLELHGAATLSTSTSTIADAFTWTGGNFSGTKNLSPRSATRIDGPNSKQLTGGQMFLHGAATWAGTGTLTLSAQLVLDGLLVVEGTATLAGNGGNVLRNWGTIAVAANASLSFAGVRLDNSGILQLSGGSVRFSRDQHFWHDGGWFAGTGTVQVTDTAAIFPDGRLTVDPGVTIEFASGTLNNSLIIEGGGTFAWTGGSIFCAPLEIRPGCHTILDGTATKTVAGQVLIRDGITWRAGPLQLSGTGLTTEGRLDIVGAVSSTGPGTVINSGTIAVAQGASWNLAGSAFDHFGTLELAGGTVDLQQATHHWRDGSKLTGTGVVQIHSPATVIGEGHIAAATGVTIQLVSGTLNGPFVLEGGATLNWLGGTLGASAVELRPGCPLVIDGTATKTLNAPLTVRDATTISGGGTLQVAGSLINEGRITVQASTPITGSGSLTNSGTIAVGTDLTLSMAGPISTHTGTFELTGGTVDLQSGGHTWAAGSRLTGTGTVQVHSPATLTTGVANAAATIAPGVTVQLVNGTINAPFLVQGGGTLAWLGGTIGGVGTVEARTGCPVLIDGAAGRTLGATFVVRGATTWRGGGTVQLNGALVNQGVLTMQASVQLNGAGTVRNVGTIACDPAVNLTMAGPALDHLGTFRLAGGTLALQAGTHNWRDGSVFDGTGAVTVTAGSVAAAGRVVLAPGLGVQFSGGILTGPVAFDGGGTLTWTGGTIGTGSVDVYPACAVVIDGTAAKTLSGPLLVRGSTTWRGGGTVQLGAAMTNEGTLTIQASAPATGAGSLINKGTVALADGVTLTMAGPGLDHQGTVSLGGGALVLQTGSHNWRNGSTLTGTGQLSVAAAGGAPPTLTGNGHLNLGTGTGLTLNSGTLTGVATVDGGGTLTWTAGTISASGLEVRDDCTVLINGDTARTLSGNLTLRGGTTWTGGGTVQITGNLINLGTLAVQASAQVTGNNTLNNKGTIALAGGVNLTFAGAGLTHSGTFQLAGGTLALQGATHRFNDGCRFTGTGTVQGSGTLTLVLENHLVLAPGVSLRHTAGTMSGPCAIEGGGTVNWTGGTFSGNLDVRPDCPVVISGTATKTLSGSLTMRGASTWSDGGTLQATGSLVNEGTLTLQTSAQIGGSNTFTNKGTIALAEGINLTLAGSLLDHSGVVRLANGALILAGQAHNWREGSALTGAGQLTVNGTATLNGTGLLTVEPGVGIVVNVGTLNVNGGIEGGGTLQVIEGTVGGAGGGLEVRSDCVVVINGTATKTVNGKLTLRGATTWSESGIVQITGTLLNEGSFTIEDDAQWTGNGTMINKGTVALADGVNLNLNGPGLDHSGVLELVGGTVDFQKSGVHSWRNAAAFTGTGILQVHSPAAITAGGHLTVAPGVTVQLVSGSVGGTLTFEGGGSFNWQGGSLGPAEFRAGCPVLFDSAATKTFAGALVLRGETTWTGAGALALAGRSLTNTGRLLVEAGAQFSGAGTVTNQGTITLSPGVVLALAGSALSNTGILELGTGTLQLGAGTHNLLGRSEVDIELATETLFGKITSTGTVNLAGTLLIDPATTGSFTVVTAQSLQATTFTEVLSTEGIFTVLYTATAVTVLPPSLVPPSTTIFDLNGQWLPGPVISVLGNTITVDMSPLGRPTATGVVLDPSTIQVTFPDGGTFTGQLATGPQRILWSNNTVWTKA